MESVQFNEPQYGATVQPSAKNGSFLVKLVIGMGLATDQQGAEKALIAILIVAIVSAILISWLFGGSDVKEVPDPALLIGT